jgi:hypothetical protein
MNAMAPLWLKPPFGAVKFPYEIIAKNGHGVDVAL